MQTGSYHRSGLEGLGLGKMTICWLKPEVEYVFKKVSHSETCPFENVRIDELEQFLIKAIGKGKRHVLEIGKKNREWMTKHWHPRDVCQEIVDFYMGKDTLQSASDPEIRRLFKETKIKLDKNPVPTMKTLPPL